MLKRLVTAALLGSGFLLCASPLLARDGAMCGGTGAESQPTSGVVSPAIGAEMAKGGLHRALVFNAGLDAAEAGNRTVAYVNARLFTAAGPEIERGVLLVRSGKVVAAGAAAEVAVPVDAMVVDCAGKFIMPGLVDTHSHISGIGGADGSATIQPDVRVYDSINTRDPGFRRVLAGGLTTINIMPGSGHLLSGQTIYLKPKGIPDAPVGSPNHVDRVEQLAFTFPEGTPAGGMKMANGTNPMREPPFAGTRGKAAAMVRQSYIKAQEYREKIAQAFKPAGAEKGGAGGGDKAADQAADSSAKPATAPVAKVLDPAKLPARDLAMEGLVEVLTGKRIVHHHTHRADDIMTVVRLAEEFQFKVVLHHVSEAYMVADEIAKAQRAGTVLGCSVIIVDSPGGKLEASQMRFDNAAQLHKAGVRVAFHTDDWITDSRLFLRMAALGARAGLPRQAALEAVTINGAIMMGLQERVGSLVPGKDADFVILSGDPLSVYSHVERTFIDGRCVFDLQDPADALIAQGGPGAGSEIPPYMCCAGEEGWVWRSGSK